MLKVLCIESLNCYFIGLNSRLVKKMISRMNMTSSLFMSECASRSPYRNTIVMKIYRIVQRLIISHTETSVVVFYNQKFANYRHIQHNILAYLYSIIKNIETSEETYFDCSINNQQIGYELEKANDYAQNKNQQK